jgi:hypothetical protein
VVAYIVRVIYSSRYWSGPQGGEAAATVGSAFMTVSCGLTHGYACYNLHRVYGFQIIAVSQDMNRQFYSALLIFFLHVSATQHI